MSLRRGPGALRLIKADAKGGGGHLPLIIACEHDLEEALHFLVHALDTRPKRGKKPVVMHSLRVALILCEMDYSRDVIVAGVLHDLLEKTSVSPGQVTRRFGPKVSLMVKAVTNSLEIDDSLGRYFESALRCEAVGEGALLVRAADLLDNCDRLLAMGAKDRLEKLAAKLRLLIQVCRRADVDARMIDEMLKRHRRIGRRVGGTAVAHKKARATRKAVRGR